MQGLRKQSPNKLPSMAYYQGTVSVWSCWLSADSKICTQVRICRRAPWGRKERNTMIDKRRTPSLLCKLLLPGPNTSSFQSEPLYVPPLPIRAKVTSPVFCSLVLVLSHPDLGMCPGQQSTVFFAELNCSSFHARVTDSLVYIESLLCIWLWGQSGEVYCQGLSLKDLLGSTYSF